VPPTELASPDLSSRTFLDATFIASQREDAEAHLNARATELRESGARVETLVLMHPRPAQAILDAADEHHADSIALSTHGRGAAKRLLFGSVADAVIRQAKVPVLVCRPELVSGLQPGGEHAGLAGPHG
jgi:nucleotide-binding universal stress UspA family protein